MPRNNPQVDKYIDSSAVFAKLILKHLRNLIRQACEELKYK
jgi:hypothetical protein